MFFFFFCLCPEVIFSSVGARFISRGTVFLMDCLPQQKRNYNFFLSCLLLECSIFFVKPRKPKLFPPFRPSPLPRHHFSFITKNTQPLEFSYDVFLCTVLDFVALCRLACFFFPSRLNQSYIASTSLLHRPFDFRVYVRPLRNFLILLRLCFYQRYFRFLLVFVPSFLCVIVYGNGW